MVDAGGELHDRAGVIQLEIGAGKRPTPGFIHNDLTAFPGVDLVCSANSIEMPDDSVGTVLALGVIEHLTHRDAEELFARVYAMLERGGRFYFDVPDLPVWAGYLVRVTRGHDAPFTREHIYSTIYGWQRWPGDEHRSGWDHELVRLALDRAGFERVSYGVRAFVDAGFERRRMARWEDAHIYAMATRL